MEGMVKGLSMVLILMCGITLVAVSFESVSVEKSPLDTVLRGWGDASNMTKLEAWAHYIFHDLNSTWDGTLDGNMSWLTSGNQLFMQYFAGNFTDAAGEPAFTNKTLFDTYFQLVNNATERLNGRVLARWIAGVEEFGNDSVHLNGVTGWGIIDPIEFRTTATLIKAEPRLADYGNLTLVLAEANATHDGINASEIQTLSSIVDTWENFTWTERRYLEIGLHPVNKSFQWKDDGGSPAPGMYWVKPVNDTGDFLWKLWLNSTARGILGNDLLANKTLFWYAATFNKFLDKGEWNGLWRDQIVYELTLNWIKFFGPRIKAAMSLPNATIAIRKYPCIYGASNIDQGFNETFIDPYRSFNVTVNGTTYQINGLLQDIYEFCWGPNRTVDWRAKNWRQKTWRCSLGAFASW